MDLRLAIEGRLSDHLEEEAGAIAAALHAAAVEGADVIKRDWRRAVRAAGLGDRVANTIRSNIYPPRPPMTGRAGSRSFGPASMVFSRAPHILTGHTGATISPEGKYLPVPTEFTPLARGKVGRGRGAARMSLPEFLQAFGQNSLARVPLPNGNIALVARAGWAESRSRTRTRGRGRQVKSASRRGEKPLIMFVLVERVRLPRRIDLEAMYARAERHWPRILRAALARALGDGDAPPAASSGGGFASAGGAGGFAAAGGASGFEGTA